MTSQMTGRVVAIVGMCGAGKSIVSDRFVDAGYQYVRFGQITLDEVKRRGILNNTAQAEKEIREGLRKEYGMGAFATLNIPKIDELLLKGNVIADGLYSWSEYTIMKEKYGKQLTVLAVYAPPHVRYERLEKRSSPTAGDPDLRYRSFTREQAKTRDYAEIENIEKGGPIAMADVTLLNTDTIESLNQKTSDLIKQLNTL